MPTLFQINVVCNSGSTEGLQKISVNWFRKMAGKAILHLEGGLIRVRLFFIK